MSVLDPNEQESHEMIVEDMEEGMNRMMDEGGGVVDIDHEALESGRVFRNRLTSIRQQKME